MSRQRGRGPQGRDANRTGDEEITLQSDVVGIIEAAATANSRQKEIGQQILELEDVISKSRRRTVADISALDDLYRKLLKAAEEEAEIYRTSDVVTKLGLLKALRSSDESQVRNPPSSGKGRNVKRSLGSSAVSAMDADGIDSPGPSPGEAVMSDKLKRVKTGPQRSASVASQASRSGDVSHRVDDGADGLNRGTNAEKAGQLIVGAEVMFKHKKLNGQQEGEGIQCVIKHVLENDKHGQRKKYTYEVQDIDEDQSLEQRKTYKTTAAYLIPIPKPGQPTPNFSVGKQVLARYPDTTTFYRAEVMVSPGSGSAKDSKDGNLNYSLKFEEDDKWVEVDRRLVLDIGGK